MEGVDVGVVGGAESVGGEAGVTPGAEVRAVEGPGGHARYGEEGGTGELESEAEVG